MLMMLDQKLPTIYDRNMFQLVMVMWIMRATTATTSNKAVDFKPWWISSRKWHANATGQSRKLTETNLGGAYYVLLTNKAIFCFANQLNPHFENHTTVLAVFLNCFDHSSSCAFDDSCTLTYSHSPIVSAADSPCLSYSFRFSSLLPSVLDSGYWCFSRRKKHVWNVGLKRFETVSTKP